MAAAPLLLLTLACAPPRALTQDAYVWQRDWTPEVEAAVRDHGADFARLGVLAAELRWGDAGLEEIEVHPDAAALAGRPVVAVLRVGAWRGSISANADLPRRAAGEVARLRAAGLDVVELQLDVDAASAQLADYARAVEAIRAATPVPLTITALPDWLSRPELPGLLDQADGWTLQLHDLRPPSSPADLHPLLDPRAQADLARAATLGRPFRVALPTYSYTAAFTPEGRFLGATAEREQPWGRGVITREIAADPTQIAALVADLRADPPRGLLGISWFRLPTEGDGHAWRQATLDRVMRGEAPSARLRAAATPDGTGLVELTLSNDGDADADAPDLRVVSAARPLAADGYGDWQVNAASGALELVARPGARLAAGVTRAVGWVRYAGETEVSVHVQEHAETGS